MADEERTPEQALNDALGYEPPEPAPDPEPGPAADPEPTPAAEPKYVVAGKPYADESELVKALENANTALSQRQAPAPEPEPEPEPDPWAHVPGIPQEQKDNLYKYALESPLEAGQWAWENRDKVPREILSQVIANAQQADPAGWAEFQYDLNQKAAERLVEERTARYAEAEAQNIGKSAEATLRAELGAAYDQYEPLINERVSKGQYVAPPPGTPTEQAVLTVFRNVYRDIWLEQNWGSLQAALNPTTDPIAAATGSQPAPAPVAAQTARPGAAAPPPASDDEAMDAAIQRALGFA